MNSLKIKKHVKEIKCFLLFSPNVAISNKIKIIATSERRLPKVMRRIMREDKIYYN